MSKAVRLDKFLADSGRGTRSEVKKYIQKGLVQVNDMTVKKAGTEDRSGEGFCSSQRRAG